MSQSPWLWTIIHIIIWLLGLGWVSPSDESPDCSPTLCPVAKLFGRKSRSEAYYYNYWSFIRIFYNSCLQCNTCAPSIQQSWTKWWWTIAESTMQCRFCCAFVANVYIRIYKCHSLLRGRLVFRGVNEISLKTRLNKTKILNAARQTFSTWQG